MKVWNVLCNAHLLPRDEGTGLWEIPDTLQARRLVIEVSRENECISRRSLYSMDTTSWRGIPIAISLDRFGQRHSGSTHEACCGQSYTVSHRLNSTRKYSSRPGGDNRVFYIGRNPGEIAISPSEPVPRDWSACVAIPIRKRGCAIYCATDLNASAPTSDPYSDRKRIKRWKEVL